LKLKKIYFDAFKSLLNKEIEIKDNCIGLVGINESGKSNILQAINALRGDYTLSEKDIPKMGDGNLSPSIKYEFILNKEDREQILDKIRDWSEGSTLVKRNIDHSDFNLIYKIVYDQKTKKINNSAELTDLKLNKGYYVLKKEYLGFPYKIKHGTQFVEIQEALIINDKILSENKKYAEECLKIEGIENEINDLNKEINQGDKNKLTKEEIDKKKKDVDKLTKIRNEIIEKCKEFNLHDQIKAIKAQIQNNNSQLTANINNESAYKAKLIQLENIQNPSPQQKGQLTQTVNNLKQAQIQIKTLKDNKSANEAKINQLKMSLEEKYTDDTNELFEYISNSILIRVEELLPNVVFWEYKEDFILKSKTLLNEIISKKIINEISRPLRNLLLTGFNVNTFEELKVKINEIINDDSKRFQVSDLINDRINKYLNDVWKDYDQKLKITFEENQLIVKIFDFNNNSHSYYDMQERSQGAKTFLSFLFTIGSEAKHGILKKSILLLDEPESHLHPSGVRYLLKELNKIAEKGNQVIYATHSPFMIDKEHYERHFITTKKYERTEIIRSCKDRVGYFMQEEVLFSTIDKDFKDENISYNNINFICEGNGDIELFQHYYFNILTDKNRPFKNTDEISFYHGGKCSDIIKFLKDKPIQLGTIWIFIIDSDEAANKLKRFIESQYKKYLNDDIYVFQYINENEKSGIELEDLLPNDLIINCLNYVYNKYRIEFNEKEINDIKKDKNYTQYSEKIFIRKIFNEDYEKAKADFKEILNSSIQKKLEMAKNEQEFAKEFPGYFIWVKSVIESVVESLGYKEKVKKEES
jgi:predicted ATPase